MRSRHPIILAVLVSGLASGCALPTGTQKGATKTTAESVIRTKLPAGAKAPQAGNLAGSNGQNPATGATVISNNGAGVISNNAASLSGVVRAPASLIANNGAGIVSNNSAGYRLLGAVTEPTVGNATVQLLDAEGKAITGADGQVLRAVTDKDGRYAFQGILPANNLLVVVDLGEKGLLRAIAPKAGGETRKANMDLISTLTTSYILNQYVAGQADRQKTFDKLPPSVEAETRAKAQAAFQQTNAAVPATVTEAAVVSAVNALRQGDTAFNDQMEVVKKLLIAAGQSDLGNGRPGTEVNLGHVGGLLLAPDGTLYVSAPWDRRLWKLDAQGKLLTAAGKGSPSAAALTGKAGPDAELTWFSHVGMDAQGRALILEDDLSTEVAGAPSSARLSRLGTDGKLTEISRAIASGGLVVPGQGDEVLMVGLPADDEEATLAKVYAVSPGQAPRVRSTLSDAGTNLLFMTSSVGVDAQGGILMLSWEETSEDVQEQVLVRLDAATGQITRVLVVPEEAEAALDTRGNLFLWANGHTLTVRKADGTTSTVATRAQVPRAALMTNMDAGTLAPDGSAYLSLGSKVFRVANGQFTRLIGTDGQAPATGKASDLSLEPGGLAVIGASFFVSDTENHRVLRINADQTVTTFAGSGRAGRYDDDGTSTDGDGGAATAARVGNPGILRTDALGNVYIAENYRIRKVAPDGTISTVFKESPDSELYFTDFAVAPDGTLYVVNEGEIPHPTKPDETQYKAQILKFAPGAAQPTKLKEITSDWAAFVIAVDKAGVLHYMAPEGEGGQLVKWTAQGAQVLKTDDRFEPNMVGAGCLAIDGQGRAYFTTDDNRIHRYDPAAGTFTIIAGAGSAVFSGGGVDQSLDTPGFPAFDDQGNMYLSDTGHRQIKRIPANQL